MDNAQPAALLGCPFCGQVPVILPMHQHGFTVYCENEHCPAPPETRPSDTEEQAVAKWNRRYEPERDGPAGHAKPADAVQ